MGRKEWRREVAGAGRGRQQLLHLSPSILLTLSLLAAEAHTQQHREDLTKAHERTQPGQKPHRANDRGGRASPTQLSHIPPIKTAVHPRAEKHRGGDGQCRERGGEHSRDERLRQARPRRGKEGQRLRPRLLGLGCCAGLASRGCGRCAAPVPAVLRCTSAPRLFSSSSLSPFPSPSIHHSILPPLPSLPPLSIGERWSAPKRPVLCTEAPGGRRCSERTRTCNDQHLPPQHSQQHQHQHLPPPIHPLPLRRFSTHRLPVVSTRLSCPLLMAGSLLSPLLLRSLPQP